MDPEIRRLAVPTEDHPMEYAKFKGDIPEGQYGAGHVSIWDNGTYDVSGAKNPEKAVADGTGRGKFNFILHGKKLKGEFALVRMNSGEMNGNWLLIKKHDEYAGREVVSESRSNGRHRPGAKAISHGKPGKIDFTHLDKVLFPEAGVTKGDLIDYYRKVSRLLLPHLRNRPMTLERLPDGLTGKNPPHFWQKNTPDYYPEWIPRVDLPAEDGRIVKYLLVNDEPTLLYLVNQGTITFHPWFSTIDDPDHPTFCLFDLDPAESKFADAVVVAKTLHEVLTDDGVKAFLKTSGKRGLHIMTPWTRQQGGFEQVRKWAAEIAERVVQRLPKIATTERRIAKRGSRLYVDIEQNAKGKHAVPSYVVRATPMATVSMPLKWSELTARLDPSRFTLQTALKRIRTRNISKELPS
jgi:bifunctional non-homologous end joining protein LigD